MSQFLVRFRTTNAAFVGNDPDQPRELTSARREEIATVLRNLASQIQGGHRTQGNLLDSNGNTVGTWEWATDHRKRGPRI